MAKKNITNKVIGIGTGLALGVLSLVSNAQDYSKIQKGVNARTVVGETPTHVIFHYGMNKDLQKAIKSSKKPHLYLTGDKNSYMIVDSDTSGFEIYYNKKNFDEGGNGKVPFVVNIKGDEHLNPCDENGLGSKTNYLVSFYDLPSRGVSEKPVIEIPKEKPADVQPGSNYNITTINNTTNTTNNYYADTTKQKVEKVKGEGLELRLLLEENKTMNTIESPFFGTSVAVQLGKGAVWFGPYVTAGFGSEKSSSSTPVYHETLLNQAINLSTVTEGVRNEYANITYPIGFGGLLSVGSKDGRVRVNLGVGVVNEKISTSDVVETGYDWMSQNGAVIGEKKPYAISLKEGSENNKYIPTQKVGVDVHPFKNSGFYLGGEAQHRGKINSKMDKINYNIKAGWRFGGRKK